jgi:hypothetical protein
MIYGVRGIHLLLIHVYHLILYSSMERLGGVSNYRSDSARERCRS